MSHAFDYTCHIDSYALRRCYYVKAQSYILYVIDVCYAIRADADTLLAAPQRDISVVITALRDIDTPLSCLLLLRDIIII